MKLFFFTFSPRFFLPFPRGKRSLKVFFYSKKNSNANTAATLYKKTKTDKKKEPTASTTSRLTNRG